MYSRILLAVTLLICGMPTALCAELTEQDILSALNRHICPDAKIDTSGLPNLHLCDNAPDLSSGSKCQDDQIRLYYKILDYNKMYDACHPELKNPSSASAVPSRSSAVRSDADLDNILSAQVQKAKNADDINQQNKQKLIDDAQIDANEIRRTRAVEAVCEQKSDTCQSKCIGTRFSANCNQRCGAGLEVCLAMAAHDETRASAARAKWADLFEQYRNQVHQVEDEIKQRNEQRALTDQMMGVMMNSYGSRTPPAPPPGPVYTTPSPPPPPPPAAAPRNCWTNGITCTVQ
jgi:hypothetical protein